MDYKENIKRYNRIKLIKNLLSKDNNEKIRKIEKELVDNCEHVWICTNIKPEFSGVIEIEGELKLRTIGNHYTVKCPVCNSTQVFYFPVSIIPNFSTEIIENAYDIFIALLENDIHKANDIFKSVLKENGKKDNFQNAFNCFNTQLGYIGYLINYENEIIKITAGGN